MRQFGQLPRIPEELLASQEGLCCMHVESTQPLAVPLGVATYFMPCAPRTSLLEFLLNL